jgi:hypothetical protein
VEYGAAHLLDLTPPISGIVDGMAADQRGVWFAAFNERVIGLAPARE